MREAFASNYIAPLGPMVDAFEREFSAYTGIPYCLALSSGTAATHLALRHLMDRRTAARASSSLTDNGQRTTDHSSSSTDHRPPTTDYSSLSPTTDHSSSNSSTDNGPPTTDHSSSSPPIVLASTLTFIGSVTPATFLGCELRFIDCDRESWNMDPALLEAELSDCAREGRQVLAVVPTDLYGQCCNLLAIKAICDRHAVPVICDSAEAMGARYGMEEMRTSNVEHRTSNVELKSGQWSVGENCGCELKHSAQAPPTTDNRQPTTAARRHAGLDAWASIYSFNGNKIITTSGGGMLASHDKELIDHARKLATQARDPAPWYEHTEIGYNYRMSNVVAAIGRGQLQVLDARVRRKQEVFAAYQHHLAAVPGISFMPEPEWSSSNHWLTVILIDPDKFGADTHAVREALERENIESRPIWKPMHLQPVFKNTRIRGGAVSEALFAQGLCLPSGTAMTDADVQRVAECVRGCFEVGE